MDLSSWNIHDFREQSFEIQQQIGEGWYAVEDNIKNSGCIVDRLGACAFVYARHSMWYDAVRRTRKLDAWIKLPSDLKAVSMLSVSRFARGYEWIDRGCFLTLWVNMSVEHLINLTSVVAVCAPSLQIVSQKKAST